MEGHPLVITKLRRDHVGIWHAHVSCNGTTVQVDRRYGSWRATAQLRPRVERWPCPRDVPTKVAAALQAKVRPTEVAERRHREAVAKAQSQGKPAPLMQEGLGI